MRITFNPELPQERNRIKQILSLYELIQESPSPDPETPTDLPFNQWIEEMRKHGASGWNFVTHASRHYPYEYKFSLDDLANRTKLKKTSLETMLRSLLRTQRKFPQYQAVKKEKIHSQPIQFCIPDKVSKCLRQEMLGVSNPNGQNQAFREEVHPEANRGDQKSTPDPLLPAPQKD